MKKTYLLIGLFLCLGLQLFCQNTNGNNHLNGEWISYVPGSSKLNMKLNLQVDGNILTGTAVNYNNVCEVSEYNIIGKIDGDEIELNYSQMNFYCNYYSLQNKNNVNIPYARLNVPQMFLKLDLSSNGLFLEGKLFDKNTAWFYSLGYYIQGWPQVAEKFEGPKPVKIKFEKVSKLIDEESVNNSKRLKAINNFFGKPYTNETECKKDIRSLVAQNDTKAILWHAYFLANGLCEEDKRPSEALYWIHRSLPEIKKLVRNNSNGNLDEELILVINLFNQTKISLPPIGELPKLDDIVSNFKNKDFKCWADMVTLQQKIKGSNTSIETIDKLQSLLNEGYLRAGYYLIKIFENYNDVYNNPNGLVTLFDKLIQQKDRLATLRLIELSINKINSPKQKFIPNLPYISESECLELLQTFVLENSINAITLLSTYYLAKDANNNIGVEILQKGIVLNSNICLNNLGSYLLSHKRPSSEYLPLFEKAANQGSIDAASYLALYYGEAENKVIRNIAKSYFYNNLIGGVNLKEKKNKFYLPINLDGLVDGIFENNSETIVEKDGWGNTVRTTTTPNTSFLDAFVVNVAFPAIFNALMNEKVLLPAIDRREVVYSGYMPDSAYTYVIYSCLVSDNLFIPRIQKGDLIYISAKGELGRGLGNTRPGPYGFIIDSDYSIDSKSNVYGLIGKLNKEKWFPIYYYHEFKAQENGNFTIAVNTKEHNHSGAFELEVRVYTPLKK
jgi:hypothetical protein